MERDIILLPSLLLASGFEFLQTRDIKFLNNYRKHFDKTKNNIEEIFIIAESDYELGGIMNPFNLMQIEPETYEAVKQGIHTFPYVTRIDLYRIIYSKKSKEISRNIIKEILTDFRSSLDSCEGLKMAISKNAFCEESSELLKNNVVYQKLVSLHLCGYGLKLIDTFNFFLAIYFKRKRKKKT